MEPDRRNPKKRTDRGIVEFRNRTERKGHVEDSKMPKGSKKRELSSRKFVIC